MIKCIDNAVSENELTSHLKPIELYRLRDGVHGDWDHVDFPFYMGKDVSTYCAENWKTQWGTRVLEKSKQTTQFNHSLIIQHRARPKGVFYNSKFGEVFHEVVKGIVERYLPEYKDYSYDRMKLNLLMKTNTPGYFNIPHIDEPKKHISIVLYLSDSDGETVFFKEREDGRLNEEFTEVARIKPKFGRAVVSDGHFHCSSNPYESDFRLILNTVLIHPDEDTRGSNK